MRAIGAARRGDVVFLQELESSFSWEVAAAQEVMLQELYRESGVRCVVIGPAMRLLGVAPRRKVAARRGPTPRWCRR